MYGRYVSGRTCFRHFRSISRDPRENSEASIARNPSVEIGDFTMGRACPHFLQGQGGPPPQYAYVAESPWHVWKGGSETHEGFKCVRKHKRVARLHSERCGGSIGLSLFSEAQSKETLMDEGSSSPSRKMFVGGSNTFEQLLWLPRFIFLQLGAGGV